MVKMEFREWGVPFVLVVFLVLVVNGSFALYTPPDSYLIACGSSKNITFQGHTFVPDTQHTSLVLKTGNSFVASSNSSSVSSPIYQSARVFAEKASYRFGIQQQGRHWVRLYFSPLPNPGPRSRVGFVVAEPVFGRDYEVEGEGRPKPTQKSRAAVAAELGDNCDSAVGREGHGKDSTGDATTPTTGRWASEAEEMAARGHGESMKFGKME